MGISIPVSSRRSSVLGNPMITRGAPFWVSNIPSIAANVAGWWRATMRACSSPVGKICSVQKITAPTTPIERHVRENAGWRPLNR